MSGPVKGEEARRLSQQRVVDGLVVLLSEEEKRRWYVWLSEKRLVWLSEEIGYLLKKYPFAVVEGNGKGGE